jgi:CHAT domain-containing protein
LKSGSLARIILASVLALIISGSVETRLPSKGGPARITESERPEFFELRQQGNALFNTGKYLSANLVYESGYTQAISRGEVRSALRFLNNLGSSQYAMFRYRDAIKAYLRVRELAVSQGDDEMLAAACSNLSNLYYQMGDLDAAIESANQGLRLPPAATAKFKAKLLIQSALIRIRQMDWEHALTFLHSAIAAAHTARDLQSESQAWNELGTTLLQTGRIPAAEHALLEALRLRESTPGRVDIFYFYESLAELRLRQGNVAAALDLYDKAAAAARPSGPGALWEVLDLRGRARLAQGRLEAAYSDFSASLDCLRQLRAEVLPADAFRVSTEVEWHDVYSNFIETGSKLYRKTGRPLYAVQTFAVAEESRAASLRALWAGSDLTSRLPPEYGQTLSELQQAQTALLGNNTNGEEAVRHARVKLSEIEMKAGLDFPPYSDNADRERNRLLNLTRTALGPEEAFFGFHLGQDESCVWAITRDAFEFRRLPPLTEYSEAIARFAKTVSEGSPEARMLGQQLYHRLFGSISRRILDKSVWILAPEGALFELPFAALVQTAETDSRAPRYLIERHAIRIVPGVSVLLGPVAPELRGPFVGIGDPIYNQADDRFQPLSNTRIHPAKMLRLSGSQAEPMELARLPGTGREVERCSGIWRSHGDRALLLEGAAANTSSLLEALRQNPQVLHIAGHVLFPASAPGPGMLAFTLQPDDRVQLLSSTEIAAFRAKIGLVVLDGCSSARAAILPGAGLMGMTRAWMAAGARAVIAARWPIADREGGELFQSFYRFYYQKSPHRPVSFARILQAAQIEQLHSDGPHASPAYWASYFCVERN